MLVIVFLAFQALKEKNDHFQYTTPRMRTLPEDEDSEMEAPNAPLLRKHRSRQGGRSLAKISVMLFPEESEESDLDEEVKILFPYL